MAINASINGSPRQVGNNSSEQNKGNDLKVRCENALSRLRSVKHRVTAQPVNQTMTDLFVILEDTLKILQELLQENK